MKKECFDKKVADLLDKLATIDILHYANASNLINDFESLANNNRRQLPPFILEDIEKIRRKFNLSNFENDPQKKQSKWYDAIRDLQYNIREMYNNSFLDECDCTDEFKLC